MFNFIETRGDFPKFGRARKAVRARAVCECFHSFSEFSQTFVSVSKLIFSKRIFSTPAIFKATSKLFGSQGCSDEEN